MYAKKIVFAVLAPVFVRTVIFTSSIDDSVIMCDEIAISESTNTISTKVTKFMSTVSINVDDKKLRFKT